MNKKITAVQVKKPEENAIEVKKTEVEAKESPKSELGKLAFMMGYVEGLDKLASFAPDKTNKPDPFGNLMGIAEKYQKHRREKAQKTETDQMKKDIADLKAGQKPVEMPKKASLAIPKIPLGLNPSQLQVLLATLGGAGHGAIKPIEGRSRLASALAEGAGSGVGGAVGNVLGAAVPPGIPGVKNIPHIAPIGETVGTAGGAVGGGALVRKLMARPESQE